MKNIKTFIIGFLSATCLFLFISWGEDNEVGRYQINSSENGLFFVDTKTGKFWKWLGSQWIKGSEKGRK